MRTRAVLGVVTLLAIAGCGSSGQPGHPLRRAGGPGGAGQAVHRPNRVGGAGQTLPGPSGLGRTAHVITGSPVVPVSQAQRCSTDVAAPRRLGLVEHTLHGLAAPFGVVSAPGGRALVALSAQAAVAIVSGLPGAPRHLGSVQLPSGAAALGMSAADGGHVLLVASQGGAVVLDTARALAGRSGAVLGTLGPGATGSGGAIEVAATPDGHYAFVSLEEAAGRVSVYDLRALLTRRQRSARPVATVGLGSAPVGLTVSPDGRWLYATSEFGGPAGFAPAASPAHPVGTVAVIDIARAVAHQPAVVAAAPAGCTPVRVASTDQGSVVWVTARASDELLAFSAARLRAGAGDRALLGAVRVGPAPVGVQPIDGGNVLAVADSNRFGLSGTRPKITFVSAAALLAGRPSILGDLPAGAFPREMALSPDGRILLVGDYGANALQVIGLTGHP